MLNEKLIEEILGEKKEQVLPKHKWGVRTYDKIIGSNTKRAEIEKRLRGLRVNEIAIKCILMNAKFKHYNDYQMPIRKCIELSKQISQSTELLILEEELNG